MKNQTLNTIIQLDESSIFDQLVEAKQTLISITQGAHYETGTITNAASAVTQAFYLAKSQGDLVSSTHHDLVRQAIQLFTEHEEWHEEILLENNFSALVETLEGALDSDQDSPLTLGQYLLVFDQVICALSIPVQSFQVYSEPLINRLTSSVSQLVDLYPEPLSLISTEAQAFIQLHQRPQALKMIWEKITETPVVVEELARLKRQDDELDLKQPFKAFDFFAGLETEEEEGRLVTLWTGIKNIFGVDSNPLFETYNPALVLAHADKGDDFEAALNVCSHPVVSLENHAIECYLTLSAEQHIKFNVEAERPISNMRLKVGQAIINTDQDDLSITAFLDLEQATESIQLLIDDQVIYETSLANIIKR